MNTTTDSPNSSRQESFGGFRPHTACKINAGVSHENLRKKRSKLIRIGDPVPRLPTNSNSFLKPKFGKKPEPGAPKIILPCSECGKQFWSWKALFGHMRCHPERQWRGINPPPKFRQPVSPENRGPGPGAKLTEEDQEVATYLIMLANGSTATDTSRVTIVNQGMLEPCNTIIEPYWAADVDGIELSGLNCRFKCSSCKKVFGSHQALGGHRATHKNVKGCFAIARNEGEDNDHDSIYVDEGDVKGNGDGDGDDRSRGAGEKMDTVLGRKCSICFRVFSSGQALGGHMRCHWEKGEESPPQGLNPCVLDLNLPAPIETGQGSSSSFDHDLDLRLGI